MRTLYPLVLVIGLVACGDDLPDDYNDSNDDMGDGTTTIDETTTGLVDPTTTSTTTSEPAESSTSTGAGGTFGEVDECTLTSDCDRGEFCVAPFDESLGPEGKGLNACVSECVDIMVETLWCTDASACCDPTAECTDRGYCVIPGESTGEESTGGGSSSGGGTEGSSSG